MIIFLSQNFSRMYIAAALLEDLINYEEIQQPILMGLVGMLKAAEDSPTGPASSTTAAVSKPLLGKLQPVMVARWRTLH